MIAQIAVAHQRVQAMPKMLVASLLALAAFVLFVVQSVLVRMAADRMDVFQILFIRQSIAVLLMAPLFWRVRADIARFNDVKLHLARGVFGIIGMFCGLSAVLHLPLGDTQALQLAEALFLTVLAAFVLKERVGWQRWVATGVGFAGVLIMLGPFQGGFGIWGLITVVGAMVGAMGSVAVRLGAGNNRLETVIFWQALLALLVLAPIQPFVWIAPTGYELAVLVAMGLCLITAQLLFTSAIRMGEAAALAPLHYVRLVMMAGTGYALYGEIPTVATVTGAALIMLSAGYTLRENGRRRTTIVDPPTQL